MPIDNLQTGATANGNGLTSNTAAFDNAQIVEIAESAGGTATVTLQGSFDGATWYGLGFQQTDATASLTRSVTPISVLANAKHVYQILDPYPQVRAVISSIAGGGNVTVRVFSI